MSDTISTMFATALRRLYVIRFVFALVWAALVFLTATAIGPMLTSLLIVYPLADAAAVLWQLRAEGPANASRVPEGVNVVLSIVAAVALGWVSTVSVAGILTVWGIWAITSGIVQVLAAVLRRRLGGQVPLILSGGISVLAGLGFALMSSQAANVVGVGGYAILGGIFFLVAALRLGVLRRRSAPAMDGDRIEPR